MNNYILVSPARTDRIVRTFAIEHNAAEDSENGNVVPSHNRTEERPCPDY